MILAVLAQTDDEVGSLGEGAVRLAGDRGDTCACATGGACQGDHDGGRAEGSHTDSFGPLTFLPDGLGLLTGSVCPHYDSEPGRRPSYRQAVAEGSLPAGWALDDGVGALFTDGVPTDTVTRTPGARLYRVEADGSGGVTERPLPCRTLTGGPTR